MWGTKGGIAQSFDNDTTYIRLLETEDLMLLSGARLVTTLTWFRGDCEQAASCLQERFTNLLGANPWLTGRIVRKQSQNYLAYAKKILPETAVSDLFSRVSPKDSPLDRFRTPIVEASALVKERGWTVQPKWNHPVYAVTVIPCRSSPITHFALVVSMSHIVGDGHTFYKLYNYLVGASDGNETEDGTCRLPQLEATRIACSLQQLTQIVGNRREPLLLQSSPALLPAVFGLIIGKLRALCCRSYQTTQHYFFVDTDAIQCLKQQATKNDCWGADFCSSNDIVTSWFLTQSQCRHGFMVVNLRGRLDGHTDQHAGNYFTLIYYRSPSDTSTPGLIRRSIPPLKRHVTASVQPGPWLGGGIAVVTNWVRFATDRVTLATCQEELHVPVLTRQLDSHPANVVLGVVFRARGNQLGMLVCGTPSKLDGLLDSCPFAVTGDFI